MSTQFSECPKCGSNELDYGDYEFDNEIWQPVECTKCSFTWQEVYQFSHNETCGTCIELNDNGDPIIK